MNTDTDGPRGVREGAGASGADTLSGDRVPEGGGAVGGHCVAGGGLVVISWLRDERRAYSGSALAGPRGSPVLGSGYRPSARSRGSRTAGRQHRIHARESLRGRTQV
jgi:hypothetical protein